MDLSSSTKRRLAKVVVVVLLILGSVTTIALYIEGGVTAIPEGLLLLYLGAVLAYGVFEGELETPRVQTAFGIGVAGYALLIFGQQGGILWVGIAGVAIVLVIRNLIMAYQ